MGNKTKLALNDPRWKAAVEARGHLTSAMVYAARSDIYESVDDERDHQDRLWGLQSHRNGTGQDYTSLADSYRIDCEANHARGVGTWSDIFLEEVFEAMAEKDPQKLAAELVQALAVGVNWLEDLERKNPGIIKRVDPSSTMVP